MKEIEGVTRKEPFLERNSCRSCGENTMAEFLSLGEHYLPGFGENVKTEKVPLTICFCENCTLVQLKHTTHPHLLWNENYGYRSGVNETMRKELSVIARKAQEYSELEDEDIVVDIGANDGTLLKSYTKDVVRVGFDPSKNLAPYFYDNLKDFGVAKYKLFGDFFRKEPFLRNYDKKAKVVTAISMFYDLEDPNQFVSDVKDILNPRGIFVIQQNYIGGMLEKGAFDNICHEHLEYYSLTSLQNLLHRHDMEVFYVTTNDLNGGSFRTYIRHKGAAVGDGLHIAIGWDSIYRMKQKESKMALNKKKTYKEFASRVELNTNRLGEYVRKLKREGKKVYIYGASTRGGTLLQAAGLDHNQIDGAAERNSDKWGKYMQSTGIPMVSEDEAREKADVFIVLPWFFKKEFVEREIEFVKRGGKMVFPLPEFTIIGG
jgi:NDP-4-keto-2,6-dideoxyhexose 3-C-methyltransferase